MVDTGSVRRRSSKKSSTFLHWRAMQRWLVGYRAPKLCKLLLTTRSSPAKIGLHLAAKIIKLPNSAGTSSKPNFNTKTALSVSQEKTEKAAPRASILSTSARMTNTEIAEAQMSPESPPPNAIRRSMSCSSAAVLPKFLRRNSDATPDANFSRRQTSPANYSRFSVDGANPYSTTSTTTTAKELPKFIRLGSASARFHRQNSANFTPAAAAKIKDTCSRLITAASPASGAPPPPALLTGDLLLGNYFLSASSAAPGGAAEVSPSPGLLHPGITCKSRDSDLKDRLVFFL